MIRIDTLCGRVRLILAEAVKDVSVTCTATPCQLSWCGMICCSGSKRLNVFEVHGKPVPGSLINRSLAKLAFKVPKVWAAMGRSAESRLEAAKLHNRFADTGSIYSSTLQRLLASCAAHTLIAYILASITHMETHTTPDGVKCNTLRKIAVFCGASSGNSPEYMECAAQLGQEMVRRGIGLVYGGEQVELVCPIISVISEDSQQHGILVVQAATWGSWGRLLTRSTLAWARRAS